MDGMARCLSHDLWPEAISANPGGERYVRTFAQGREPIAVEYEVFERSAASDGALPLQRAGYRIEVS